MDTDRVAQFVNSLVDAAAQTVGATSHVQRVELVGPDDLPEHVAAQYSPLNGGRIMWQEESAAILDAFLSGRYRQGTSPQEQLFFLSQVRGEMQVLFHEVLHSIGVADELQFLAGFMRDSRSPGLRAALEGSNELIAQAFLPTMIERLGLDRVDPRIAKVPTPDMGAYPGQVAAMYQIYSAAAEVTGTTITEQLIDAARLESGGAAMLQLVQRCLATRGMDRDPEAVTTVGRQILNELGACQQEFFATLEEGGRPGAPRPTRASIARDLRVLRQQGTAHGRRAVAVLGRVLQGRLQQRSAAGYRYKPLGNIRVVPGLGMARTAPAALSIGF